VDVTAFLIRAPEFVTFKNNAPNGTARIQTAIDDATARTDASVFGVDTEAAIFYLAAHLLAASPSGKDARLKGEGFASLYLVERQRLEALHAPILGGALSGPQCVSGGWEPEW
jgi:hypothetical protein